MLTLIGIMAVSSLPLLILGLLIRNGKGLMLIAGYNTMTQTKRDQVDKDLLARTIGNLLLRMAGMTVLLITAIYIGITWVSRVLVAILLLDLLVSLSILNRNMPQKLTSQSKASTVKVSMTIAITVLVAIGVGVMFYYGEKEPMVNILDNSVQIKAMYGTDINFANITDIYLIDKSMQDLGTGRRTNGYGGFGETLKGHFNSEDVGKVLLFVQSKMSPTIWITRDGGKDIYISLRDGARTKLLYQELITAVRQNETN